MRLFLLLAAALTLAACTTTAQRYAAGQPGLTPAQRRIFQTGRIPAGEDVAGLTRAQIRIAMGRDPSTYDQSDDGDVWIYTRKVSLGRPLDAPGREPNSSMQSTTSFTDTAAYDEHGDVDEKTAITFQGDRAIRARITEEKR